MRRLPRRGNSMGGHIGPPLRRRAERVLRRGSPMWLPAVLLPRARHARPLWRASGSVRFPHRLLRVCCRIPVPGSRPPIPESRFPAVSRRLPFWQFPRSPHLGPDPFRRSSLVFAFQSAIRNPQCIRHSALVTPFPALLYGHGCPQVSGFPRKKVPGTLFRGFRKPLKLRHLSRKGS
jgi:hypothetical protein